jgi:DNA repair protein RadA/Sms
MVEVANPSALFLEERGKASPGSAVVATLEGTRPLLAEIQALVSATTFSLPRRTCSGLDLNRLHLLLAILGKRAGLPLHTYDVYCNVAGGLRLGEPAADLPLAMAIVSSFVDVAVPDELIAFGELGLSGEVRGVGKAADRLAEARKLGFTRCLMPAANHRALRGHAPEGIEIIPVHELREALRLILPGAKHTRARSATPAAPDDEDA